ncbi:hypothetical protein MTX35_24990 [Rhodococcus sp. ARC_M12]|uniref:hypothetical protein n=1 Tax=Rhodococcus sp. ARC_M12 TaxID=2928854 RepID=UPI001FB2D8A8|nr:hypothetical protein [Rhodococcus sp. ARC_M12]MCJ0980961.1 hypothetical protein [Rhodococcus sp. ARC_M12]
MRTDTAKLKVQAWLAEPSKAEDFDPALKINTAWWQKTLTAANREAEVPPAVDGRLSRKAIFQIASLGMHEPQVART